MRRVDVCIVGGGMVGLCLAAALKGKGLEVVLVERGDGRLRTSLDRDMRVSAIVAANQSVLEGLSVWRHLSSRAQAIESMWVWDDQYRGGIRFEADEIGLDALGFVVENHVLVDALKYELEEATNIEIHSPAEIRDVHWGLQSLKVELTDGLHFQCRLLVGADGAGSWVRRRFGIKRVERDYRQCAIVATVRPQLPHGGAAYQRFLETGPLAMLPLSDNLCSIVWSCREDMAGALMKMDDARFLHNLELAFGPSLGRLQEVGTRGIFPLKGGLARHFVRPRVALVGDAAHVIHPLAGLGVNLGIRDAMVLAQELVDAVRFGEDVGDMAVLTRYATKRAPDVLATMAAMEGFHQLFTRSWKPLAIMRNLGLALFGNTGFVKEELMRRAVGLTLPVPRRIV